MATSPTNTGVETPPSAPPAGDIGALSGDAITTPHDRNLAALELALARERDGRAKERFFVILVATIVVDLFFMSSVSLPALSFVGALEVVMLIGLANVFGVEEVAVPLRQLWSVVLDRLKRPPKGDAAE